MRARKSRTTRNLAENDVGTLWTMRLHDRWARCALISLPKGWEVRVLIEDHPILTERRTHAADAFALGDAWKHRMSEQGWRQIVPTSSPRALDDQQTA